MIVQSPLEGESPFVITMAQHTDFAGKLARHFGNDGFEAVSPREQMLYVIANHDIGWRELDTRAPADPQTNLPYHLVQTPFEEIVATSSASPNRISQEHAYCGLLSSMHSWGLYNGRYGMSDVILLDNLADQNREVADRMLSGEIARQEELKKRLSEDPATAGWIEEDHLFQNYKQLQFFDTMALYFNCTPAGQRETATFTHVPRNREVDVDIEIKPEGDEAYSLHPYPFDEDGLELSFEGRYFRPGQQDGDGNLGEALLDTAVSQQGVRLVAA